MEIIKIKHTDEAYPKRLLQIKDFPKILYAIGDITLLNREHVLGMVGSRHCTEYGRSVAYSFAKKLASWNITVISGLAIGIDAASHMGAVEQERKNNCSFRLWHRKNVSKRK